jgi:hypothetical protein
MSSKKSCWIGIISGGCSVGARSATQQFGLKASFTPVFLGVLGVLGVLGALGGRFFHELETELAEEGGESVASE